MNDVRLNMDDGEFFFKCTKNYTYDRIAFGVVGDGHQ